MGITGVTGICGFHGGDMKNRYVVISSASRSKVRWRDFRHSLMYVRR